MGRRLKTVWTVICRGILLVDARNEAGERRVEEEMAIEWSVLIMQKLALARWILEYRMA
jgi:hypothetical protein